jgi:predicted transcriptional regulator
MRKNAYWMKKEDDRIMEFLDRNGWASPEHIESESTIDISEGHVKERLKMLRYAGLVDSIWSGAFEITLKGMMYLAGELDASHQPTPTVNRVLKK